MEWLNQIFIRLMSVLPRIIMLRPFEAGVRTFLGKYIKRLGPGWYMYWPWVHQIVYMETQTQVVDLRTQSVQTTDDKEIIVSGAIQYRITDVEKAILNVQDVDASLETLALGIILDFIHRKTMADLKEVEALKDELLKGMREAAKGWGVKIEKVYITDLGRTRNFRLLMNLKSGTVE